VGFSALEKNFQNGIPLLTAPISALYTASRDGWWVADAESACDERSSKPATDLSKEANMPMKRKAAKKGASKAKKKAPAKKKAAAKKKK
jgi:hypothetical protein